MTHEKAAIDDEQIIALYESGFSQNDIVGNYHVSVQRTRTVLQNANFNTRGYRALNDTMKYVITSLVRSGVYYLDVERVTDISFHAIRDFVTRSSPIENRRNVPPKKNLPSLDDFPERDAIVQAYESGTSFCILANAYSLDEKGVLQFYLSLSDRSVEKHCKMIQERIISDVSSGLSVSVISRKYWISRAIIKKYIAN